MLATKIQDDRPDDIRARTYRCDNCGAVMLRPAAEERDDGPHCPICEEPLSG